MLLRQSGNLGTVANKGSTMANKGHANLKPCKKGETHNPNGRPKNTLTLAKEAGLSKTDIYNVIVSMIGNNAKELQKIKDDASQPIYKSIISSALLGDLKKKQISTVESIFDRVFGKPTQKSNVSGSLTVRNRLFD